MRADLVGRTAIDLAGLVRRGEVAPVEVVRAHLERIAALDGRVGAFQVVRAAPALAEAERLGARGDLAALPLAGVPVAIKDNVAIAGEPMRSGSAATPEAPSPVDHEAVRRLRDAGAIVVGLTRMPELGLWATTDGAFGTARNPWDPARTPGGSSGGSAAAVAAAMTPVALGNDGLGSIRIPAACCGLVGIKPGPGVVPSGIGRSSWRGLVENGPLATTVDDAALMLSVLAARPDLGAPAPPDRPLRVAVSTKMPLLGARLDREFAAATRETGRLLADAGHGVREADPPYSTRTANAVLCWWFGALAEEAASLDGGRLEPRTRRHAALGRLVLRRGWMTPAQRERWRRQAGAFFAGCDLLVTPGLARPPIAAARWSERSWLANVWANARYAPFAAPWNFAGYPAAAVPAGRHSSGLPLAVQLVVPPGHEARLLAVARALEGARPWPRHAPLAADLLTGAPSG